jgi:P-type Ca2+ transporter type 2C
MSEVSSENLQQTAWHAMESDEALQRAGSASEGLSDEAAKQRLEEFGENRLKPPERDGPLVRLLRQFHNILIYILIAAAVITALLSHWIDMGVILAVVFANALIGFIQEGRAEKALEALQDMLSLEATVLRGGKRSSIPAEQVVPGDVVMLRSGDKVPADMRLLEARELRINEAMLTGESVPAEKTTEAVAQDAAVGDRDGMAFSGTLVTSGQATGVVVGTGERTQIGQISEMVSETQAITTPLIAQMDRFGRWLAVVIVVFSGITFALGYFAGGYEAVEMFLATVAMAVALIPEGLPAIMTIALAIGVRRMADRQAIIRRLPAVDTLGALTVICSDKTGTLTRNEMTATRVETAEGTWHVTGVGYAPDGQVQQDEQRADLDNAPALSRLLHAGLLCNDAELSERDGKMAPSGDPMEAALITLAMKAGLDTDAEREARPAIDTIPFDSAQKYMATLHDAPEGDDGRVIWLKGAPERLAEMCDAQWAAQGSEPIDRDHWQKVADEMAGGGQRVLAVAYRPVDADKQQLATDDVDGGLVLLGLVGIIDPPRAEAIEAVAQCHDAGIRVKMITGDHKLTASAIGKELAIGDGGTALAGTELDDMDDEALTAAAHEVNVFARVSPQHKLRLVKAIQQRGEVVAMTGDGVNDAPALKRADVGIAMGIKGTEVSKEASEMVLTDDNFASIADAVEEGRTVYDNLRKSILFILPTNGGEGLTILAAILFGRALPLTPVQVLWVNMITAVTLALALAFEPPEKHVMKRKPRRTDANLLDLYFLWRIAFVSALISAGTFGMFLYVRSQGASEELARTVAVNTLVMFEVFYLLNTRFITAPTLTFTGLFGSRVVLYAIGLVLAFQMIFTYLPIMQWLFGVTGLSLTHWLQITVVASSVLFLVEIEKLVVRRLARPA